MRSRPSLALSLPIAIPLALMLATTDADADDAHYNPYPIGGRAVGLGGAYTALADDPSGMFYNPAGIVDVARSSLQVSTNLYGFELDVGERLVSTAGNTPLTLDTIVTELQIIPTTAGGVVGIGKADEGGYRHAYALGVFVPSTRNSNLQTSELADGVQDAYRRNVTDRTILGSAAYAYRLDDTWRVGATASFGLRSLHDQEETSLAVGGGRFDTAETSLDLTVATIAWTFGLKAILDDTWTVGVAVTTPTTRVFDRADVRVVRSFAEPSSARASFDLSDSVGLRADTRVGAIIRAGVPRAFPDWSLVTLDLSFYAPTRYALLTAPSRAIEEALTLATAVERRWLVNVAVGYERMLGGDATLCFGAYTNLPSSPPIDEELYARDQLPHVTSVGASAALGLLGDHTETHFGLTGSYGWGRDVIARNATLSALGEDAFRAVEVQQLRVFLSLSSTFKY